MPNNDKAWYQLFIIKKSGPVDYGIDLFSSRIKKNKGGDVLYEYIHPTVYDIARDQLIKKKFGDIIITMMPENIANIYLYRMYGNWKKYPYCIYNNCNSPQIYIHRAQDKQFSSTDSIQVDVRMTKDNEFILFHDPTKNGKKIIHTTAKSLNLKKLQDIIPLVKNIFLDLKNSRLVELKDINSDWQRLIANLLKILIKNNSITKCIIAVYTLPPKSILELFKYYNVIWCLQGHTRTHLKQHIKNLTSCLYFPQYLCYPASILTSKIIDRHFKLGVEHFPYGNKSNLKSLATKVNKFMLM